jgi:hypothetical protein
MAQVARRTANLFQQGNCAGEIPCRKSARSDICCLTAAVNSVGVCLTKPNTANEILMRERTARCHQQRQRSNHEADKAAQKHCWLGGGIEDGTQRTARCQQQRQCSNHEADKAAQKRCWLGGAPQTVLDVRRDATNTASAAFMKRIKLLKNVAG